MMSIAQVRSAGSAGNYYTDKDILPVSVPVVCTARNAAQFTGRMALPHPSDASPFCRYFSAG
ncbi:hypothetical protein F9222_23945 [Escherichia coli]|nr:hypothetical protein F9222_23945 [Escherichia coli]